MKRAVDQDLNKSTAGGEARDVRRNLPHWSAYLDGLSKLAQVQNKAAAPVVRREQAHPPIGDRRAGRTPLEAPAASTDPVSSIRQVAGKIREKLRLQAKTAESVEAVTELRQRTAHPIGDRRVSASSPVATFTLGKWSFYFIIKFGLYWKGLISFHALPNLFFALLLLLPVTSRIGRLLKNVIASVLAVMLLYYDSWLPPFARLISQASLLSEFSFSYLVELLSRFVNMPIIGTVLIAWLVFWVLSRWLRIGVVVFACLLGIWLVQSALLSNITHLLDSDEKQAAQVAENAKPDMDRVLQDFFDRESQRSVVFTPPAPTAAPFDVIFLQVCSLSWEDVRAVGLEQHPLWGRFDFLLSKFNSAASYSGPAAVHLLRGSCGQTKHEKMYTQTAEKCYLLDSLQQSGFEPNFAMNHNGKFDDFIGQVQTYGRVAVRPLSLEGLSAAQYAFDNSVVYDDYAVLNRWIGARNKSDNPRAVLYYNTTSLHDGNHLPGTYAEPNTAKTYGLRLSKLLDNIEKIIAELERSGRRAVLVMVPEHGAALSGDKRQISGLREIPTPAITLVPVGIKVVGGTRAGESLTIDQSTSFLAISHIVQRMLEKSPYGAGGFSPADYVVDLPLTPFVSQNERSTVAEYNHRYYLNRGEGEWEEYEEFNKPDVKP